MLRLIEVYEWSCLFSFDLVYAFFSYVAFCSTTFQIDLLNRVMDEWVYRPY